VSRPAQLTAYINRTSRSEALRRLAEAHPVEYRDLLAEERAKLQAVTGWVDGRMTEQARERGRTVAANNLTPGYHR
jgi:hypothetical protein